MSNSTVISSAFFKYRYTAWHSSQRRTVIVAALFSCLCVCKRKYTSASSPVFLNLWPISVKLNRETNF